MADRCDNDVCTNPATWEIGSVDPNSPKAMQLCNPCKLDYEATRSLDPARSQRALDRLAQRGASPKLLAQARGGHDARTTRLGMGRARPGDPPTLGLRPTPEFAKDQSDRLQAKRNRHQEKMTSVAEHLRQRGYEFPDKQRQAEQLPPVTEKVILQRMAERIDQRIEQQRQDTQQRQQERQERQRDRDQGRERDRGRGD